LLRLFAIARVVAKNTKIIILIVIWIAQFCT
jgi:hypothetical protein